ncbi:hypothetical protein ACOSQ3_010554 [Xanthoceras sorbifolium]
MRVVVSEFFQNLFASASPFRSALDSVLSMVERKMTAPLNSMLAARFTPAEIQSALFQMSPLKAPGPDGLPAGFSQRFRDVVGCKLVSAVLAVLNEGADMGAIGEALVVLIPKVKLPVRITECRPISLCNVAYKVIAKVLANRLKQVLTDLISPQQSAFVLGCLITDNVIVGFESLHCIRNKRCGKNGFLALKLDMSKAYDKVE